MDVDFSTSSIQRIIKTGFIGRMIAYYPSLISTMDTAREAIRGNAPEGMVIIAGEQTGGRGRLGRSWISPGGNIALSVILYPDISCLSYLVMIASLAAAGSLEAVTGMKAGIKWPNDVLIEGKKVCGILIENEMKGGAVVAGIVGIGINVTLRQDDIEEESYPATGLEEISGRRISRVEVVGNLLNEFEKWYRQLPDGDAVFQAWQEKLVTLGKPVKARSGDRVFEGIAETVDKNGALVIRGTDGMVTKVVAGEVTLRD